MQTTEGDKSDIWLHIWAVYLCPSHLRLLPILTQWWFITVSFAQYSMVNYFCHFSEEFLSFVLLGHTAVSFKSNCGSHRKFYVHHSMLDAAVCVGDFIMNPHGVIDCVTLPGYEAPFQRRATTWCMLTFIRIINMCGASFRALPQSPRLLICAWLHSPDWHVPCRQNGSFACDWRPKC